MSRNRRAAKKSQMATEMSETLPETNANSHKAKIRAPSLLNTFVKPSKLQNASPLLRMAAELRLKVLRYLMRNKGPILDIEKIPGGKSRSFYYNSPQPASHRAYQFSSQIFQCCQQLYEEGRYVLYKENEVMIDCTRFGALLVFDHEIDVPKPYFIEPHEDIDLLVYDPVQYSDFYDENLSQQVFPALAEFDSLIISLKILSRIMMYKLARVLKHLLHNKKVKIGITKFFRRIDRGPIDINWLSSCQIWRCKELEFTSHYGPKVDKLQKLITSSDNSIHDHVHELKDLQDIYQSLRGGKHIIQKDAKKAMKRLEGAVMSCNSKLVTKHKQGFLEAAKKAVEDGKEVRRKALEEEKVQMEKEHDELLSSIVNHH